MTSGHVSDAPCELCDLSFAVLLFELLYVQWIVCVDIKSMWNLKIWAYESSETPYSITFSYMVTSSRIILVVILLVFIILQPINSCSHAHALDISSFFELTTYQVVPPKGKHPRKKATHEWHRTTIKSIAHEVKEQLDAATVDVTSNLDEYKQVPNVSKLHQQRESLRTKLGTLNVLDGEILSNVEEEEIEDKIRKADLVNELIQLTTAKIEDFLEAARPPTKSVDALKLKTPVSPSVSADPSDVKPLTDSVESPVRLNVSTEVVHGNFEPSNHSAQLPNSNPTASSPIQETGPRA